MARAGASLATMVSQPVTQVQQSIAHPLVQSTPTSSSFARPFQASPVAAAPAPAPAAMPMYTPAPSPVAAAASALFAPLRTLNDAAAKVSPVPAAPAMPPPSAVAEFQAAVHTGASPQGEAHDVSNYQNTQPARGAAFSFARPLDASGGAALNAGGASGAYSDGIADRPAASDIEKVLQYPATLANNVAGSLGVSPLLLGLGGAAVAVALVLVLKK